MSDRIHLVFCLFQRNDQSPYPMALAATYSSIRQRTSAAITVHVIVDDSVAPRTRRRLRRCMAKNDKLCFIAADTVPESANLARTLDSGFSPAIIWRAWLPEYLPSIKRCILLDCDLQVLLDIKLIWNLRLNGRHLSAFQGGKSHPSAYYEWIRTPQNLYFRMGVCLMDLRRIRGYDEFLSNRQNFLREAQALRPQLPQAGLLEQSLYNRYFSASYLPLPFPLIPSNRLKLHQERMQWVFQLLQAHEPVILDLKGWLNNSSVSLLFWSSLLSTPWRKIAENQIKLGECG